MLLEVVGGDRVTFGVMANNVHFSYPGESEVLSGVDLSVSDEVVALTGSSGSGKTTLLLCVAGILVPSLGSITVAGNRLDGLSMDERSKVRRENIGMVFQFSELIAELSLVNNVALPLELLGWNARKARLKAQELLDELGIGEIGTRFPSQVSGGQAQRAAVARALIHEPSVILADEPTGALDKENSERVLNLFLQAARRHNTSVVLVTHDCVVASHADRQVELVRPGVSSSEC